jgi:nucleoside-diphosphate-sugar epimerase
VADSLEILLIGGSGFMGRHVARELLAADHRVATLSRGRHDSLESVTSLTADRHDPRSLAQALEGRRFDATVDFLVYDSGDIETLRGVEGRLGRYVMISTGQVYLVGEGVVPPYREQDAERPLRPEPGAGTRDHAEWSYGVGKRRAERAMLAWTEALGATGLALRLPIVQGEGDGSLRLWAYLERMLDGGPLVLPDGGRRPTRFLHARDLAQMVRRLSQTTRPVSPAYNLAQPEVVPLDEFLMRIAEFASLDVRFVDAPWAECRAAGLDEAFSPYASGWTWCSILREQWKSASSVARDSTTTCRAWCAGTWRTARRRVTRATHNACASWTWRRV